MPDPDFADDLGPAAQARASRIVTVGGERKSAIKAAKVEARRYDVECRVDALNAWGQLSDRQWAAGVRFRFHWRHSTWHPRVTATYGEQAHTQSRSTEPPPLERSVHVIRLDEWAQILTAPEWAAMAAVAGEDESCAGKLRLVQSACNAIADNLKIDKEFSRR